MAVPFFRVKVGRGQALQTSIFARRASSHPVSPGSAKIEVLKCLTPFVAVDGTPCPSAMISATRLARSYKNPKNRPRMSNFAGETRSIGPEGFDLLYEKVPALSWSSPEGSRLRRRRESTAWKSESRSSCEFATARRARCTWESLTAWTGPCRGSWCWPGTCGPRVVWRNNSRLGRSSRSTGRWSREWSRRTPGPGRITFAKSPMPPRSKSSHRSIPKAGWRSCTTAC